MQLYAHSNDKPFPSHTIHSPGHNITDRFVSYILPHIWTCGKGVVGILWHSLRNGMCLTLFDARPVVVSTHQCTLLNDSPFNWTIACSTEQNGWCWVNYVLHKHSHTHISSHFNPHAVSEAAAMWFIPKSGNCSLNHYHHHHHHPISAHWRLCCVDLLIETMWSQSIPSTANTHGFQSKWMHFHKGCPQQPMFNCINIWRKCKAKALWRYILHSCNKLWEWVDNWLYNSVANAWMCVCIWVVWEDLPKAIRGGWPESMVSYYVYHLYELFDQYKIIFGRSTWKYFTVFHIGIINNWDLGVSIDYFKQKININYNNNYYFFQVYIILKSELFSKY